MSNYSDTYLFALFNIAFIDVSLLSLMRLDGLPFFYFIILRYRDVFVT